MNTQPLVSICVPTYNPDLTYLRQLLQSIEVQTWSRIEIVISDDQSTNYAQLAESLPDSRFPVMIKQASQRLGMAGNWNESVSLATGDYVLVTGQDDIICPDGIRTLVEAALTHDVEVVFGGQGYIGSDGLAIANPSKAVQRRSVFAAFPTLMDPDCVIELGLVYGNILGDPCSTLIKRPTFLSSRGFREDYKHAADLELWLHLAAAGSSSLVIEPVVACHRSHQENATASHVRTGIAQADRLKLHSDYSQHLTHDKTWNRSVARLHTHHWFDAVRYRILPEFRYPGMRGSLPSQLSGWFAELAELARLRKPRVHLRNNTTGDDSIGGS